ncbi:hypothetical protein, partial [Enorma sp.]|uniref:hypothetical protein n=1 Tax=Enorma sp. TaxID=1920692 RepID=UPI003AB1F693
MKNKSDCSPLIAKNNSGWIEKSKIADESAEILGKYLKRFVCETECFTSSKMTNGFIRDFKIDRTERATSFMTYMRLIGDPLLRFRFSNSPAELANHLNEDGLGSDSFIESKEEFVYITFS